MLFVSNLLELLGGRHLLRARSERLAAGVATCQYLFSSGQHVHCVQALALRNSLQRTFLGLIIFALSMKVLR